MKVCVGVGGIGQRGRGGEYGEEELRRVRGRGEAGEDGVGQGVLKRGTGGGKRRRMGKGI